MFVSVPEMYPIDNQTYSGGGQSLREIPGWWVPKEKSEMWFFILKKYTIIKNKCTGLNKKMSDYSSSAPNY
ncbi:MAG: hypothetical protein EA360_02115 [Balneolaceae bacterium]|nr:MAG: hypothetical protein EA360_02115 [Balneolaceae bacterium]